MEAGKGGRALESKCHCQWHLFCLATMLTLRHLNHHGWMKMGLNDIYPNALITYNNLCIYNEMNMFSKAFWANVKCFIPPPPPRSSIP